MRIGEISRLAGLVAMSISVALVAAPDAYGVTKSRHSHTGQYKSSSPLYKGKVSREVLAAEKLMADGKYQQAADMYRDALNKDPKDVQARVGFGMACVKQFALDRAGQEFDKALNLDPKNAMAHCGKAMCAMYKLQSSSMTVQRDRASYLSTAEKECGTALDIDPQLPEAHYTIGLVYKEQGNLDKAVRAFEGAAKLDPKFSEPNAALGLIKLQQNDLEGAESDFKKAVSLNSGNSTAHYGLGQTYLKKGMVDQAIDELNTSLYQNRNSAPVHLALGKAYELQGNSVAAIKEYQQSISIKPENPSAYIGIANIREQRGDIEHAIAELRSGLELTPNNPELLLRIANGSLRLEKLDDAIKAYEQVLNVAPRSTVAVDGLTRSYYLKANKETASAFVATNDFEQAEASIARAIRMNPNSMQLRLAQAKLRALSGKPIDLRQIGTPTTDPERVSYAEALLAENKFDEAAMQMNTVIADTTNAKDAFAVGDLALTIKDLNSAEAAYRKGATMEAGAEERAQRGLAAVQKSRDANRQAINLGSDLEKRKQYSSAIDQFKTAIYNDPHNAQAREYLAMCLEKLYADSPKDLREASKQYRVYLTLDPSVPVKEKDKLEKHIAKLDAKAYKLEQKGTIAKR
jgi:tetratricopeptide (TPR) repeat protein